MSESLFDTLSDAELFKSLYLSKSRHDLKTAVRLCPDKGCRVFDARGFCPLHQIFEIIQDMSFLSCLYGSARADRTNRNARAFLSCLYGSAQILAADSSSIQFLSCLYGSARPRTPGGCLTDFLSCLYGSAHEAFKARNCMSNF